MRQGAQFRRVGWMLLAFVTPIAVHAQLYPPTLMYQLRDKKWSEGLQAEPKSAEALALVSAIADVQSRETYLQWPNSFQLRFFLPRAEQDAGVTIRQITSPRGYYRLDNVTPPAPWKPGSVNDYQWPSTVIAGVYEFQVPERDRTTFTRDDWMADLGVVVSVGDAAATAGRQELTVSPAALFHSTAPRDITAYLFTWRSNAPAGITYSILSSTNARVFTGPARTADANSPFTIRWPVAGQAEGWYRLVIDASFTNADGRSQQWIMRFYHRPSLAR